MNFFHNQIKLYSIYLYYKGLFKTDIERETVLCLLFFWLLFFNITINILRDNCKDTHVLSKSDIIRCC